ncbi:hypothetical protein Bca4012_053320 [Brassica carinata]|uniref:Uncharacterized protein n=1 Tax=Brassica carinata TaxID=52824 RepID=A0A8X7RG22_BRACI|nr:hypothetical protein Bca52824_055869 [Brassica carinata]
MIYVFKTIRPLLRLEVILMLTSGVSLVVLEGASAPIRSRVQFPLATEAFTWVLRPEENTWDVMSHSFGEGYATRSDEEGFGGTYGGNQTFQKDNNDKVHENHPDYDKTQGSEAKEKQKARNQT